MRRLHFIITVIVLASALSGSAAAFSAGASLPRPTPAGAVAAAATRIETDQKTGTIRFIVKGREEARLDGTGLHVRQGVTYGNTITDVGQAGYGGAIKAAGDKP